MGNCVSSIIFVPKEFIKQTLQIAKVDPANPINARKVIMSTLQNKGVRGLFVGYRPTIMRNVPGAVIRFCVYEELKHRGQMTRYKKQSQFLSGAIAGAVASGLTTPVDVLKTSFMTGRIGSEVGVIGGIRQIVRENGVRGGLFAGGGARILWSGVFGAVGFGSFEIAKEMLGVVDTKNE